MYAPYFHYQVLKANRHSQQCAHVWAWANLWGWKAQEAGVSTTPELPRNVSFPKRNRETLWLRLPLVLEQPGYIVYVGTFPGCFHREPSRGAPRGQRRHPMLEPPWYKGLEQGETFPVLKLLLRVFFSLWFLRELFHREFQALYEGKLFNLWFLT